MKIVYFIVVVLMSLTSFAGPLTNLDEKQGDKLLSQSQKDEYKRLLDEGVDLFNKNELDKAEEKFLAILKFAPKKPLAYYNLGLVKYKKADYQSAINNFDQVIQMRSYYTGAAFYYKALAQYNMGDKEGALKTARRQTEARYFYQPSQSLIKVIQKDSDPYFELATSAYASQNYELCLRSLQESIISDSMKAKEFEKICRNALDGNAQKQLQAASESAQVRPWRLFANARFAVSDNATQVNSATEQRSNYYVGAGGEYIFDSLVDFGFGAGYEYYDVINTPASKNETVNVYAPISYVTEKHQWQGQVFYNHNKSNSQDTFSETGLSLNYNYNLPEYLLGVSGNWSHKTSLAASSDYVNGPAMGYHLNALKFIEKLTLGVNFGVDQNRGGDVALGTSFLPTANVNTNYSLTASYSFNQTAKLSGRIARSEIDFNKIYSTNGTDRKDTVALVSVTYLHYFNSLFNAYLQQSYTDNDSNYANTELVNKNYRENSTTLGLSLNY